MLLLIQAANYLDVKPLLDLLTTHVAHLIVEARTPEGIRKRFNIKNDLTPEDLKKVLAVCEFVSEKFCRILSEHKVKCNCSAAS